MKRVQLEPAYVLHRRAYRETSCLVELFTRDHGRLTVVARGVNRPRSALPGLLQPFIPLLVSFAGKGELMSLTEVEVNGTMGQLQGDCLFAGFYLNELLMSLLEKWDAHAALFAAYEKTVGVLQGGFGLDERVLRSFEKYLLEELGYGLLPKSEASLLDAFSAQDWYRFVPELGFSRYELNLDDAGLRRDVFSGKSLIAIARDDWNEESLFDAKRLIRLVLTPLLGKRNIHSRRLFMQFEDKRNDN